MNSTANLTPKLSTASVGPADGLPGYAQLFKSIFEGSAAGMLVLDVNGRCVWANQTFCNLIGYTAEEVLANTLLDITHPDDVAISLRMLRRLTTRETKGYQIEKRYIHKSGRPVWVLLTVALLPQGHQLQPDLVAGLIQDISQRKAAEAALQRSEGLFRSIAENAGDLIVTVDYPEMKKLYVSPAYQKFLGYSANELQDREFLWVVHPDDLPIAQHAIEEIVHGKNGIIAEMRVRHKNGTSHGPRRESMSC